MKRSLILFGFLIVSCIAFAAEKSESVKQIPGFRALTWKMSTADAKKIYGDLVFGWNAVNGNTIYKRTNEDLKIGETIFDEIRYSFRDDKFNQVMAIIEVNQDTSKSGVLEQLNKNPVINFDRLKKILESRYGAPAEYREDSGKKKNEIDPLFISQKKAIWLVGESRVVLELMTGSTMKLLGINKGQRGKNDFLSFSIENVPPVDLGF